jgi:hypothetical protein
MTTTRRKTAWSATKRLFKGVKAEVRRDMKMARKFWLPWWAILLIITGMTPIFFWADHLGKLNLVMPVMMTFLVVSLVIKLNWEWRQYTWFWVTLTILAAVHVPLCVFIPWPDRGGLRALFAGLATIDTCVMLGILALIHQLAKRRPQLVSRIGSLTSSNVSQTPPKS